MPILAAGFNHINATMKKKSAVIGAGIAIAVFAATTYASPHWQLYRMRAAVEAHDAQALSRHVDFPSLRDSVKRQIMHRLGADRALSGSGSNPFAAFGKAMALAVIDPVVDAAVSPAGVAAMLDSGDIRFQPKPDRPAPQSGDSGEPGERARAKPNYDLSYRGWNQALVARADGGGVVFVLERHGLWGWKLAAVEMPDA
jgi:hypothetical protein